jgi:hypothetical protein
MILALIAPLIISFMIFLVANSFGVATLPAVGYGLNPVCTTSGGTVAYLWLTAGTVGGAPAVCNAPAAGSLQGPDLPIVVINALNSILVVLAVIVAVIAGIRLAPSLVELLEES